MPCNCDGYGPTSSELASNYEAIACGLMTYIESRIPDILEKLDYKEMGVSQSYTKDWWKRHKENDEKRRRREQEEKDRKVRFEQLKQTLSPEDLKIIKEHTR